MADIELTLKDKSALEEQVGQASAVLSFYLAPPIKQASLAACERALQSLFSPELSSRTLLWLGQNDPGEVSPQLRHFHAQFHSLLVRARLVAALPDGWDIIVSDFTFDGPEEKPVLRTEFHKLSGEAFAVSGAGPAIFNLVDHFLIRFEEMAAFDPGRRWLAQNRQKLLELRSRFDSILMALRDDAH